MNKECEYCRVEDPKPIDSWKEWDIKIGFDSTIEIEHNYKSDMGTSCTDYSEFDIKFCPMCGRKL
jgi:hypothetical protein